MITGTDHISRRTLIGSAALSFLAAGIPAPLRAENSRWRSATRLPAMRSAHVEPQNVAIWLPENRAPGERHPVLYILDLERVPDSEGRMHDASGPAGHIAALAAAALSWSAIVVGIGPSPGRRRHYAPAAPLALLPPTMRRTAEVALGGPSLSDAYLRFIVNELKPAIDAAFPTMPSRHGTSIAGAGLGGLAALYALTRHPETFVGAACLSTERAVIPPDAAPCLDCDPWRGKLEDAIATYLADTLPRARSHRIYADYSPPDRDAISGPLRVALERVAAARGYERYRDLQTEPLISRDRTEQGRRERADVAANLLLKSSFVHATAD